MQKKPQDRIGTWFAIVVFAMIIILLGAVVFRLVRWIIGF